MRWEAGADLVVVGGGVAGLTAARTAAQLGMKVLTVSKGGPTDTSTQYAQGGIAVVAPAKRSGMQSIPFPRTSATRSPRGRGCATSPRSRRSSPAAPTRSRG